MNNQEKTRKDEMGFKAQMNINYHEGCERFYSSFINWTGILAIAFAGVAFASVIDAITKYNNVVGNSLLAVLSCIVFILNGAVLAFGMLHKLYNHTDLKKRWIDTLLRLKLSDLSKDDLDKIEKEMYKIDRDEPAQNKRRLKTAYKETCVALGLSTSEMSAWQNA